MFPYASNGVMTDVVRALFVDKGKKNANNSTLDNVKNFIGSVKLRLSIQRDHARALPSPAHSQNHLLMEERRPAHH